MKGFVVALEYLGATLSAGTEGRRVPVCEHAYDLQTATLAGHLPADAPRVGFPCCQRSWNTQPQADRCPECDTEVLRVVCELITTAITGQFSLPSPESS